jgi:hypothetical protein
MQWALKGRMQRRLKKRPERWASQPKIVGGKEKNSKKFEGEGYSYVQSIILSTQMHVFIYICAWTLVF